MGGAGAAGGIPMQFPPGCEQFLTDNVEDCAADLLYLLDHPDVATRFGEAGKEHVREEFLLPVLIRNELRLLASVVSSAAITGPD